MALDGGKGSASRPSRSLPPGKDPVPIVQQAGWAPGPVWTGAENLTPPPGFDPWTIQPLASRYTDYATLPTTYDNLLNYNFKRSFKPHVTGLVNVTVTKKTTKV